MCVLMVPNRAAESRQMVPGFTGATLREWSWQRLGAESARFGMPRMKIKFAHRSCGRFSYICVSFSSVAVKKFDTYCMELDIPPDCGVSQKQLWITDALSWGSVRPNLLSLSLAISLLSISNRCLRLAVMCG